MKNENDEMDALFGKFKGQFDIHEPEQNHGVRFAEKLQSGKRKNHWLPLSIAASLLLLIGVFSLYETKEPSGMEFASAQTREADSVFTAVIKMELEKVKRHSAPENEKIITDALVQMEAMNADYEKIKQELIKNGESEQIIHAMIRNLQTRISFLENVLLQIENNTKLKPKDDEKTT